MAEVIAVIGAIAACGQLMEGFGKLSKAIRAASKGMAHVPDYLTELETGTEFFIIGLKKLIRAAKVLYDDGKNAIGAQETKRGLDMIKASGRTLRANIYRLLKKIRGQRRSSTVSRWLDKLSALLKQNSIKALQDSLDRMTHQTTSLGLWTWLDIRVAEYKRLKAEGLDIPEELLEDIDMLKREVKHHRKRARQLEEQLREHTQNLSVGNELSQDLAEVLSNSRTLDRCVERTVSRVAPDLPRTHKRRRKSRSSRMSSATQQTGAGSSKVSPSISTTPSSVSEGDPLRTAVRYASQLQRSRARPTPILDFTKNIMQEVVIKGEVDLDDPVHDLQQSSVEPVEEEVEEEAEDAIEEEAEEEVDEEAEEEVDEEAEDEVEEEAEEEVDEDVEEEVKKEIGQNAEEEVEEEVADGLEEDLDQDLETLEASEDGQDDEPQVNTGESASERLEDEIEEDIRNRIQDEAAAPRAIRSYTVGHVIRVDENNQVEVFHRRWHPQSTALDDVDENELGLDAPHNNCAETSSDGNVKQRNVNENDDIGDEAIVAVEHGSFNGSLVSSLIDGEDTNAPLKGTTSSSILSQKSHWPKTGRENKSVDIFSPPDVESGLMEGDSNTGKTKDERYKPVAPFDDGDRKKHKGKPNI